MIFNSFTYIAFLILVVSAYWILNRKWRLWLLLFSSIVFYGFWNFLFVPLLFLSIAIDYFAANFIDKTKEHKLRKLVLFVSLATNFSLLGFFKYYYFFTDNLALGLGLLDIEFIPPSWTIILPIGISFYTFQSVSYTIDVYRRRQKPVKEFLLFANYVIFFPQLVAGPILRAGEVIWQLDKRPAFSWENLHVGALRILGGLALKVILADNIAVSVNQGFSLDPDGLSVIDVSTLAFLFGFQIYFDFAAYSHIALGSARMMGIIFPENFNFPYSARSPRDFWKRWHITLSSWIRDYLYLPLIGTEPKSNSVGGIAQTKSNTGQFHAAIALLITWIIMGLWHGAAWTFALWGVWHAVLILAYRLITYLSRNLVVSEIVKLPASAASLYFLMLGWIPFRAEDLNATFSMYAAFFDPSRFLYLGMRENIYLVAFIVFMIVIIAPYLWKLGELLLSSKAYVLRFSVWVLSTMLVTVVLIFLRPLEQFIYFQF